MAWVAQFGFETFVPYGVCVCVWPSQSTSDKKMFKKKSHTPKSKLMKSHSGGKHSINTNCAMYGLHIRSKQNANHVWKYFSL